MPPNTVYVGRPSHWGNQFSWQVRGKAQAVEEYRVSLTASEKKEIRQKLKGKNLACWCALDEPCHADLLLEIANK